METVMESAADYYRHLGATSFCSGLAVECLLFLEKYRVTKSPSADQATTTDCLRFIQHTMAALNGEKEAPSSIRRIYREVMEKKKVDEDYLLEGWKMTKDVISKIMNNEEPREEDLNRSIRFLIDGISAFNDIGENVEKKLHASSWFTRERV